MTSTGDGPVTTETKWALFLTKLVLGTLDTNGGKELLSELLHDHYARCRTSGLAESLLLVLEVRGVAVPDDIRNQIQQCNDTEQLNIWLTYASTATTIDEVIRE